MPFVKGKVHPKQGGKQPGAGRKTNKKKAEDKAAADIAKDMLEANVAGLMGTYIGLATGNVVERSDKDGNKAFLVMVDPATTRHAIDRLIPAVQKLEHSGKIERSFDVEALEKLASTPQGREISRQLAAAMVAVGAKRS